MSTKFIITDMTRLTTNDIKTIVPAITKRWLLIAVRTEKANDKAARWGFAVLPVLAYGVLPQSQGAYLVDCPNDGPLWMGGQAASEDVYIELTEWRTCVGIAPAYFTNGFTHSTKCDEEVLRSEYLQWIFHPKDTA